VFNEGSMVKVAHVSPLGAVLVTTAEITVDITSNMVLPYRVAEDKFTRSMSLPSGDRAQYPATSPETKSSMHGKTIQRQFTMMTYVPSDRKYGIASVIELHGKKYGP